MLMDANKAVLVIVDLQDRLLPAIHDGGAVLAQNVRLARIARGACRLCGNGPVIPDITSLSMLHCTNQDERAVARERSRQ